MNARERTTEAMPPWTPEMPLRADSTDEQIESRYWYIYREDDIEASDAANVAREFAAAVAEPLHRQISIMVEQDLAASVPSPAATPEITDAMIERALLADEQFLDDANEQPPGATAKRWAGLHGPRSEHMRVVLTAALRSVRGDQT